jgi:signal transduction histidine kinase
MNRSIRRRILLVLLLAQGLLTAAAATAVVAYTHRQMLAAFDAELRRRMLSTLTMVGTADEKAGGIEFSDRPDAFPKDDLYSIWDSRGVVISASPHSGNIFRRLFPAQTAVFLDAHGHNYRGAVWHSVPVLDEESEGGEEANHPVTHVALAYAMPADAFRARFARVVLMAIIGSCLFLASSSLIAYFSVSRGLAPLDKLAAQASRITERSWDFHPERHVSNITELLPLTRALEGLISRLKSAFERERTFVGDAAHELKTAVAIQKSTLQVAAQGPENILEYRQGFEQALSDVDRLEALVLRMLSLASVEGASSEDSFGPVALEETVLSACEQLAPLAELNEIQLDSKNIACCSTCGDAGLLQTLWTALLENAIEHSPRGGLVTVAIVASNGGLCRVSIRDAGEGIAPDDLPRIFDRFYRADRSRSRETGGYGLGLAISKAIVERHHGTIVIESIFGQGTTVNVDLPSASA